MWRSYGVGSLSIPGSFAQGSVGVESTETLCQLGPVHALPYSSVLVGGGVTPAHL